MDEVSQQLLIFDLDTEQDFDLMEGHLVTKYPLEVLLVDLKNYLMIHLRSDENPCVSANSSLCEEIFELAKAIQDYGLAEEGIDPHFWSKDSLKKRAIWRVVRRLCRQLADNCRFEVELDENHIHAILYQC